MRAVATTLFASLMTLAFVPARLWKGVPSALQSPPTPAAVQDHWLHGFNFNVEEWDAAGLLYETLAICRQLAHARAVFKEAVAEKPSGCFMIRSRTRVVKRHPEGDW